MGANWEQVAEDRNVDGQIVNLCYLGPVLSFATL
jgi:hypothetical protein